MTWNYRVVKHTHEDTDEDFYQIHEVYYMGDQPLSITESGVKPFGNDKEELTEDMILMMQALTKPILDAKIFENDPDPKATIDKTLGMLKRNV